MLKQNPEQSAFELAPEIPVAEERRYGKVERFDLLATDFKVYDEFVFDKFKVESHKILRHKDAIVLDRLWNGLPNGHYFKLDKSASDKSTLEVDLESKARKSTRELSRDGVSEYMEMLSLNPLLTSEGLKF